MNVALLVPGPDFDGAVSGGYAYDRRIVGGLRALGHGVRVVQLDGAHPMPDDAAEASARDALSALADGEVPVVDGLGLPAFAPLADALAARGAVGLVHHPTALERGLDDATRDALRAREHALFRRLPRLVATSRLTAARLAEDDGVDPARVGVVEPGTEPAARAAGSGGPGCAIVAVGSLTPRKGHDVLLRALGRLTDLDWSLRVVGDAERDPAHAASLAALADELGIANRVAFTGLAEGADLEAHWARSDLFALASYWEGYGMAPAEAMARGLPLAVCAGGALADLVPRDAGVVAAPGDHASLSRAMRRAIYDGPLRARMADAAWEAGQRLPRWEDRAAAFAAELDIAAAAPRRG